MKTFVAPPLLTLLAALALTGCARGERNTLLTTAWYAYTATAALDDSSAVISIEYKRDWTTNWQAMRLAVQLKDGSELLSQSETYDQDAGWNDWAPVSTAENREEKFDEAIGIVKSFVASLDKETVEAAAKRAASHAF